MRKIFFIFISAILFLVFLAIIFFTSGESSSYVTKNTIPIDNSSLVEGAPLWETEGTIVYVFDERGNFWGLEKSFSWKDPFATKKLRISYLPEEFQTEGLKVKVEYGKDDVIGYNDWDTIIGIIKIQKI